MNAARESDENLNVTVSSAFWWELRVAGSVSAVVVDGEFLTHPFESSPLKGIEITKLCLIPPSFSLCGTEPRIHRSLTPINVKPLVRCYERSF